MARQQSVSNERKKELEELDSFQENSLKAIGYIKTYKKQLILIALVLVGVTAIFSIVIFNIRASEAKASLLLNKILTEYNNKTRNPEDVLKTVENDFSILFKEYSNTVAGKTAKIKFAKICYDAKNYEKAYQLYKKALTDHKKNPAMESFILSSLGHTCIALNNLNEAEDYFIKIANNNNALLKDDALFNLGMLSEKAGDRNASHSYYKTIVSEYPESIYKALAQNKLK